MNGFKHLFSWRSFDIKKIASAYTFYRTPYISAALGYKPHYEGYENVKVMLTINMMVWDRRTFLVFSIEGECNQPWPMDRYLMRFMGSSCNFSPQALRYKPHYEGYENVKVMLTINMMVWDRRTFLVSSIEGECNQPWPMDRYLMRFMGSSCNFSPQGMKNAEILPMDFLIDKSACWFLKTNKIVMDKIKGINSEFDFRHYCIYMYFYKIHMPSRGVVHLQKMISIIEYFELVSILNKDDFRLLHIAMRSGAIFVDESRIVERSSQPVTPVRLILPPDGMCKLCFDGAWLVCGDIVCSGGGYVLYNHDGVVLLRRYFPLKSVVDAFDAEVQSFHLGLLDVLKYTDFLDVVIEGNCRELIDGAWCAKYVDAAHAEPFWKLQSLLPLFKQLRIQFIYREGNRADCCAQIGLFIHQNQQVRVATAYFFKNYSRLLENMNEYTTEDSKQQLQFRVHPDWNSKKMKGDSNRR